MEKKVIATDKAPRAIGPYSQAIAAGSFIFAAGQAALDPQSGALVSNDVAAQTRQTLSNLKNVLEAAGSSLDQVVKTTVFLTSLADFSTMNTVYAEFFPSEPPARTTVQVSGLPRGAAVEIEAIALHGEGVEVHQKRDII